jgi:uncharacterized protein YjbI with pentapeptide repeats
MEARPQPQAKSRLLSRTDQVLTFHNQSDEQDHTVIQAAPQLLLQESRGLQRAPDAPNLCGALLEKVDLAGLDLSYWNLAGAILKDVNLQGTRLTRSNLAGARIMGKSDCKNANFSRSEVRQLHMDGADCTGASFVLADLTDAKFTEGNVDKADFRGAILERVSLAGVGVSGAQFFNAQAVGMVYSPQLGSIPDLRSLDSVVGLHQLRAKPDINPLLLDQARRQDRIVTTMTRSSAIGSTAPLRELQSALAKVGIDAPARAVNYSLRVAERRVSPPLEMAFQTVAYELPSAYGYRPERSLLTVLLLIPLISPLYWAAIVGEKAKHDHAGLWLRRGERADVGRMPKPIRLHARNSKPFPWAVAIYVSLLSAFRIGWHDFNMGDWIARLQRSEYKIEAIGWPRTIIGLQSLLSIYLLVRFVVEYLSL